jgi:hypothetical protein
MLTYADSAAAGAVEAALNNCQPVAESTSVNARTKVCVCCRMLTYADVC